MAASMNPGNPQLDSMASSHNEMDPPIKYESFSNGETYDAVAYSPSTPIKRRRSNDGGADSGEKRQRIGSFLNGENDMESERAIYSNEESGQHPRTGETEPAPVYNDEEFTNLTNLLERATASAAQQLSGMSNTVHGHPSSVAQPSPVVGNGEQNGKVDYLTGFSSDPHIYMRIFSLPILESLSTQILSTLAQGLYSDTIKIVTDPDSELGQAYATLKSLFDQTKAIYSQKTAFLSADELHIREPGHRETIRITNLATFASGVFAGNVGFYELSDNFVDSFAAEGSALGREPCELFLNLKTQMYLSAVSEDEQEQTKEEILELFFQDNIGDMLQRRHPDQQLTPAELWFVLAINDRRDYLMRASSDVESIKVLSEQFPWEDFLASLTTHLKTFYEALIPPYMKRHSLTAGSLSRGLYAGDDDSNIVPSIEKAEPGVQNGFRAFNAANNQPYQSGGLQQPQSPLSRGPDAGKAPTDDSDTPTVVLYRKARQQVSQKTNQQQKRPGISQRRPWTDEEERALMSGLDAVKGPHWSQILALYGENGTINTVLKDRNQVQLKDKARNLKLFFLKSDVGVPPHLQAVTGELKTRAPSQAARKEADQRQRAAEEGSSGKGEGSPQFTGVNTQSNGQSFSPSPSVPTLQDDAPEQLLVVEPESTEQAAASLQPLSPQIQQPPAPVAQMSSDDYMRQRLMAANNAFSESGPSAELNSMNGYSMST